jgi:gas vesicle protein GvpL/GvpF
MTREEMLRAVLEQLAADDVGELLVAAQRDAREVVRRRLVDEYVDALLGAVAKRAATQPTRDDVVQTSTRGCYVYAITGGVGASAATGEHGIDSAGAVEVLSDGDVAAVVSDVDIATVRRGCDEADVSEGGWLANAVRAHDRVVAAAFRSAPTIPVRFGVVYPDRESVAEMLRSHQSELRDELHHLAGRAEWNVKVFVDLAQASVAPYATADAQHAAISPGADFLTRERDRRTSRARAELRARTVIADTVQTLDLLAADRADLKQSGTGPGGAPYFAATYLVERRDEEAFVAAAERLQAESCDDTVTLTVDGPWPPFHFTSLRLEPGDG